MNEIENNYKDIEQNILVKTSKFEELKEKSIRKDTQIEELTNFLKAEEANIKDELDIDKIAELINIHHSFLKNDLKITTPEIDDMISIAADNGSIGSKIVGSGGGGSIMCLSQDQSCSLKIVNELKKYGVKDAFIANMGKGPTTSYE